MSLQKQFADKIKEARTERGWTRQELATKAECSPEYIVHIEIGKRNVSCKVLEKVIDALGCQTVITLQTRIKSRKVKKD